MNFAIALFAQLALLLPVSSFGEACQESDQPGTMRGLPSQAKPAAAPHSFPVTHSFPAMSSGFTVDSAQGGSGPDDRGLGGLGWRVVTEGYRPVTAEQVHIEQRTTIRIVPRPSPVRPDMLLGIPSREAGPRFIERKIGKCLSVSTIAGVQANGGNRLILFMRDRRIVSAELERACRARDFYSGFYIASNADGQLCVDRDTLLSRSGVNCKLSRIRQLIEIDE